MNNQQPPKPQQKSGPPSGDPVYLERNDSRLANIPPREPVFPSHAGKK